MRCGNCTVMHSLKGPPGAAKSYFLYWVSEVTPRKAFSLVGQRVATTLALAPTVAIEELRRSDVAEKAGGGCAGGARSTTLYAPGWPNGNPS
jgi:hypothetical protein